MHKGVSRPRALFAAGTSAKRARKSLPPLIELLFKKYFWIPTAGATAVIALLTALILNGWVEGRIRGLVPSTVPIPKVEAADDPTAKVKAEAEGLANMLAERRIFNSEPPPVLDMPDSFEDEEDEITGDDEEDEDGIPLSDLDISLLGTMVNPDPDWSLASVKTSEGSKLVRIGMELEESVTITSIHRTYITLQRRESKELIRLWADRPVGGRGGARGGKYGKAGSAARGARSSYRPPSVGRRSSSSGRPPASSTNYEKGVAKVGEWEYKIDRGMLENELSDLTRLGMQARVVPNYIGGKYQGFKLVGVRPNSLYRAIGVRSGDVIKRVNGMEIDSPNKALQLFEKLRTSRRISLDITRNGVNRTLYYKIQ